MPRCQHCGGQLFIMQRIGEDHTDTDTLLACLQCGRSPEDGPPPNPPRLNAHSRRAHARV